MPECAAQRKPRKHTTRRLPLRCRASLLLGHAASPSEPALRTWEPSLLSRRGTSYMCMLHIHKELILSPVSVFIRPRAREKAEAASGSAHARTGIGEPRDPRTGPKTRSPENECEI